MMKVAIAGAGNVGRAIARELIRPPSTSHRQRPKGAQDGERADS